MQRKQEIIWGDGKGVEKSYKKKKEDILKNSEEGIVRDKNEMMDQFIEAISTKEDYMKENQFIEGFVQKNDKDVVNTRLSERTLFSDGTKNPFMIDSDYSRDMDNASKYIKFGKK